MTWGPGCYVASLLLSTAILDAEKTKHGIVALLLFYVPVCLFVKHRSILRLGVFGVG
jgi:hypothetical protein